MVFFNLRQHGRLVLLRFLLFLFANPIYALTILMHPLACQYVYARSCLTTDGYCSLTSSRFIHLKVEKKLSGGNDYETQNS
jgi:hypothetical protein